MGVRIRLGVALKSIPLWVKKRYWMWRLHHMVLIPIGTKATLPHLFASSYSCDHCRYVVIGFNPISWSPSDWEAYAWEFHVVEVSSHPSDLRCPAICVHQWDCQGSASGGCWGGCQHQGAKSRLYGMGGSRSESSALHQCVTILGGARASRWWGNISQCLEEVARDVLIPVKGKGDSSVWEAVIDAQERRSNMCGVFLSHEELRRWSGRCR
jgi:hypothetical protein